MRSQNDTQLRQWAMLKQIPQYPRQITARELTEYLIALGFDIRKRTVERDLISLSSVFPLIANDSSKPYGWSWSKDAEAYALPSMSPLQALTLTLAQEHLHTLLPASLLNSLAPYFKCASNVLSSGDSVKKIANWRNKVSIVPPTQSLIPPDCDAAVIEVIHAGLLSEQQLEISYASRNRGEAKTYMAHPLGLVQRGAVTYLLATLYNYSDIRLFAMHRIQSAKLLAEAAQVPQDFDLASYIRQGAFGFKEQGNITLIVRFTSAAAEHLLETPLALDQQISPDKMGWVKLQATVADTSQLRWWLRGFADQVEVIEPAFLREEFVRTVLAMQKIY
jgi:predicted DNA-binding transcriptional regulator YafY